jgi:hypothetical protein
MTLLVKPASSVKSTRLIKKGSSPDCLRDHWLVSFATGTGTETDTSHVPLLVLDERWYGDSSLLVRAHTKKNLSEKHMRN